MHGSQEWDEYLATGIDPTGGGIGPNFDPTSARTGPHQE